MGIQLVAVSEVARQLGVSVYTVRRLIAQGNIVSVNVGARRLIPAVEVDRIVQRGTGQARLTNQSRREAAKHSKRTFK